MRVKLVSLAFLAVLSSLALVALMSLWSGSAHNDQWYWAVAKCVIMILIGSLSLGLIFYILESRYPRK